MNRTRNFPHKLLACVAAGAVAAAAATGITISAPGEPAGTVQIPRAAGDAPVRPAANEAALGTASFTTSTGFDPNATQCSYPTTNVEYWDVADQFGGGETTREALSAAVAAANNWWADSANDPDTTIVLQIDSGDWDIAGDPGISLNNLNHSRPAAQGWLVFEGAGMNATTLRFSNIRATGFRGINVHRLHICNMHLTRAQETVTQGTIVGFRAGAVWGADPDPNVFGDQVLTNLGTHTTTPNRFVVVRIDPGFPSILSVYDETFGQGRYIRKYRYGPGGEPYLVQDGNGQTSWQQKHQLANGDWVIGTGVHGGTYALGDTVAVKSKKAGEPFWFSGGDSITIENVRFTRASRLLFRNGIDHLRFSNISVERGPAIDGKVPYLSTSEGGPQIGQPTEGPLLDAVVENSRFFGTGDDAIAAFDTTGLRVSGVRIEDSFARGILLDHTSTTPCIHDTLIDRSPLTMLMTSGFAWACVTDSIAPAAPTGVGASAAPGIVTLSWTASGASDLDGYAVTRTPSGGTPVVIATGVTGTSYQDITAKAGVQYSYTLVAFDTSRNNSAASGGATITAM
ncbi:hypothetical protein OK349_09810 [Sphingomonas sp. BT-65]|uniref:hypothetical protein n=1 Tax=Sphingomonas sp. BT-65 TaxID=2989821 RepID=UPI002235CD70|nr:hypothetical protein [Sphingomonas sp. BT-65]MCW4462001.1 hypothetical protein [Sphingomonas sp. BT-65]